MSINFDWVKPITKGRSHAEINAVVMKKNLAGRSVGGAQAYQCNILIPEAAVKAARIVIGDRVEIGFGKDLAMGNCIAIRRVVNDGYKVCAATGGQQKESVGKPCRARVMISLRDGMPEKFSGKVGGWLVRDDGVLIAWEGLN
jgi:hypothetical protein